MHWMVACLDGYVLARMLDHKEAIISHLSWVSLFLGFHTLGLYVHNDVMLAFGTLEKQILIEPIFVQWIQSAHGKTSYGFDVLLSSTTGPVNRRQSTRRWGADLCFQFNSFLPIWETPNCVWRSLCNVDWHVTLGVVLPVLFWFILVLVSCIEALLELLIWLR